MRTHPVFEALRHSTDTCVCTVLRRASRASTQMYDRMLEPSGMTVAQFSLLAALYYTRSMPIKKLAQRLVMDRTTLSRNLEPLQRRKFVEFIEDAGDLRIRKVSLTADGLEALISALPYWQEAQEKMIAGLGEGLWQELRSLLRLSIDVAREADAQKPAASGAP
jgi:DNA-binding MarR family transcriptional regulator